MDAEVTYLKLKNIALQEFPDIVVSATLARGPLNTAKSLRIHKKHERIKTFPKHFHDSSEGNVKESNLSEDAASALREFLEFIRKNIT